MRGRHVIVSAVAIAAIGFGAVPVSADGGHGGHDKEGHTKVVKLRDNCDPASFDAVIGPGTCLPHGNKPNVTFAEFAAKLNPKDFGHPQWRNSPRKLEIDEGDTIKAVVKGGETHTFTEVPMFGGGCVEPLNTPLGLPTLPDALCAQYFATSTVPVGATLTVADLSPGTHKFMCVIHPWMKTVVKVERDEHEDD